MTKISDFNFSEEDKEPSAVADYCLQAQISPYEKAMLEVLAKKENRSLSKMGRIFIRRGLDQAIAENLI